MTPGRRGLKTTNMYHLIQFLGVRNLEEDELGGSGLEALSRSRLSCWPAAASSEGSTGAGVARSPGCSLYLLTSGHQAQNFPYVKAAQFPETIPQVSLLLFPIGGIVLWLGTQPLEPDFMGSDPSSVTHWLCDFGQVTSLFWHDFFHMQTGKIVGSTSWATSGKCWLPSSCRGGNGGRGR